MKWLRALSLVCTVLVFPGSTAVMASEQPVLADAQSLFYNARYAEAAALVASLRASTTQDVRQDELRTTALLFQLRGLLNGQDARDGDKSAALKRCVPCPDVLAAFTNDLHHGQDLARARLRSDPKDLDALFFLGKLDLNYVWLQLGLLGKKTGWDEYWEARHSLDAVLKQNPDHVRARVARAWIDYIVNTRMPWGTRWLLGGGNKKKALASVHAAVAMNADFYSHAEAEFALWDMLMREHEIAEATTVARRLAVAFPGNQEVATFLQSRTDARR